MYEITKKRLCETKTMNSENINWLQEWYMSNNDGDWEHTYGISICTIDNPGWHIEIDLAETDYDNLKLEYNLIEKSDNDWYAIKIEDKKFHGVGDASKLDFLIGKFKEIIENGPKSEFNDTPQLSEKRFNFKSL